MLGEAKVIDPGLLLASEDVGLLATAAGAPCVYWLLGGADPQGFADTTSAGEIRTITRALPSNHTSRYAPVLVPTLSTGVAAAQTWLPRAT